MSIDLTYNMTDLGDFIDDGQEFGVSHSDYQANEIEECLEASGALDLGNKLAQEQSNRLVRSIGVMTGSGASTGGSREFNDGKPLKTKLNWRMSTGDSLNIWVRNGSGTVWTTGAVLVVQRKMWIKDV